MQLIRILHTALRLRRRPLWGRPGPAEYPTWREALCLARDYEKGKPTWKS